MAEFPSALAKALQNRYVFERELGRGGMAAVYLARDVKHKRQVALKVLDPEVGAALGPERFEREIQVAARLTHPHIVPVHDSGDAARRLWYVMPFIAGESLRARLEREHRLPLADALRITREVAEALDYAHRQSVVHRDVKPENILLADGQALLADFGIARATAGTVAGQTLTATGFTLGTPAYMSPEQAAGATHVDGRSDVYSLGCVLYEMLAGAPPFTGATPQAVIASRFRGPPPPLSDVQPAVPQGVATLVARALALEPADRFPTAGAFATAVTLADRVPSGPSPSVAVPQRSPRARVAAVVAALIFAVGAVLGRWWQHRPSAVASAASGPTLLAVLPFENEGRPEDDYFADGLSEEVRGKLTQIPQLGVIARSSSGQYKKTTKPLSQVAGELGVRYLLTGTVRWDKPGQPGSRVRVTPELLEVPPSGPPTTRWQAPFEAPLTDVFQVQADIAARVADALHLELAASTRVQLGRRPTASLEAYQAYLQAVGDPAAGDLVTLDAEQLKPVIAALERAVQFDSTFAPAWAQLGRARIYLAGQLWPRVPERLPQEGKAAAERAVALDSTLAAAHLALGLVYGWFEDTERANNALQRGLRLAPNDPELLATVAARSLDPLHPDAAITDLERAQTFDPRSARIATLLLDALSHAQRYASAVPVADRIAVLAPHSVAAAGDRIVVRLAAGDSAGAARLLAVRPPGVDSLRWQVSLFLVDYFLPRHQLEWVYTAPDSVLGDSRWAYRVNAADRLGDSVRRRIYADSFYAEVQRLVRRSPERAATDRGLLSLQAWSAFFAGRRAEAMRTMATIRRLAYARPDSAYSAQELGWAYARWGELDSATVYFGHAIVARRLDAVGAALLQWDPSFAKLRAHVRFKPYLEQLMVARRSSP